MLIKNSRWMLYDSCKTVLVHNRLILSLSFEFENGKDKRDPKRGKEEHVWKVKMRVQVHAEPAPPVPVDPQAPVLETPPSQEELNKRIEEVEQLEQVGRSPESLPT